MAFWDKKKSSQTASQPRKKPVRGLAKSVQDILDFDGITDGGIIIGKPQGKYCCFSKLYKLIDSNFVTEPDEKQWEVLAEYTKFINRFPDNVDINIVIVNKRNTMSELIKDFHIGEQGDDLDTYRREYNAIIDKKITEGRNDITKDKYIMLVANGRDDELVIIRDVTPYLCRKLNLTEHKRWADVGASKKQYHINLEDYYRNNKTVH